MLGVGGTEFNHLVVYPITELCEGGVGFNVVNKAVNYFAGFSYATDVCSSHRLWKLPTGCLKRTQTSSIKMNLTDINGKGH